MKEFHTAMLVHEMYIPRVMNHSQQMEEEKKMGEIERKRGLKMIMMMIPHMKGPMDIALLSIDKGFSKKTPHMLVGIVKIRRLTLSCKELVVNP